MYAFKIFALAEAIARGYRFVLWIDTAFYPRSAISRLWDEIGRVGWYIPIQGSSVLGNWCSDCALEAFGIDRATARGIPLVYSGLVGLDMQNVTAVEIWERWCALYRRGTFNGPHINAPGQQMRVLGNKSEGHCSNDPLILGHRHDEAALSFVLYCMGLTPPNRGFLTMEDTAGFIGHYLYNPCPGV